MNQHKIILLLCFFMALLITYFIGSKIIPFLKKMKCAQTTKEIGPTWHKKKTGIPTMGGFMIIVGTAAATFLGYILMQFETTGKYNFRTCKLFFNLFMALGFALIGFMDDYVKVIKKQNLGLRAREKFGLQFLVALGYLIQLRIIHGNDSILFVPFVGYLDVGWLIYPINLFIILGCVNAVNITDGLDGLASNVTSVSSLGLLIFSIMAKDWQSALLSISLMGSCLGFLGWNFYPATVMMGDVGSLFLGGMLIAIGFSLNIQVSLALFGIVYVIETLSVIIQMTYFHFTKKRIFKMTPIHHSFELRGYSELQINFIFIAIQFIGCALGIYAVMTT